MSIDCSTHILYMHVHTLHRGGWQIRGNHYHHRTSQPSGPIDVRVDMYIAMCADVYMVMYKAICVHARMYV